MKVYKFGGASIKDYKGIIRLSKIIKKENHDEMIKLAENAGVFYKPSGSGGGDLGLLISNDRMRIEEVCPRLNSRGFNYFQV